MTRDEIERELNHGISSTVMDGEEWLAKCEIENLMDEIVDDYEYLEKNAIITFDPADDKFMIKNAVQDMFFEQEELAKLIYEELEYWINARSDKSKL